MPKFELKRNVTPGPSSPPIPRTLDISSLESWLWEAACIIRGPVDAPKFKDYILPLIFLKRLSDVFDDELANLARDLELGLAEAEQLAADDHSVVRLYIPPPARWAALKKRSTGLGQELTDAARAVARENPRLQGVVDVIDFNATAAGQRLIDDTRLAALVQILSQHRLGLADVEPDLLGRAYEYLLRKFAEGQGQSAGEFYTPREVGILIARLLEPEPGQTVLDTSAVSRGSGDQGSNRERDIRRAFVAGDVVTQGDLVEAVVLLPENLFYNTTAPGIIMVVNHRRSRATQSDAPVASTSLVSSARRSPSMAPKIFD